MKEAIESIVPIGRKRKLSYDLTGKKIGRWKVISYIGMRRTNSEWKCVCECGTERIVLGSNLRKSGGSESCGCLAKERASERMRIHGKTKTPEFGAWQALRNRCENPNNKDYSDYGGRNITVSPRWVNGDGVKCGFECFFEDVGLRPSSKHSIDRYPDKNGNYEPGNVRWATWTEQQNNRRSNRVIEFRGEAKTIMEWSKATGINHNTLWHRLTDMGWTVEKALTYRVRPYIKRSA